MPLRDFGIARSFQADATGISIEYATDVRVTHGTVELFDGPALVVHESTRVQIEDIAAHENEQGFVLSGVNATQCSFVRCAALYNKDRGFFAQGGISAHFKQCKALANGVAGFELSGSSYLVDACDAIRTIDGAGFVLLGDAVRVQASQAYDNRTSGFVFKQGSSSTCKGCSAVKNEQDGFSYEGAGGSYLSDCVAHENGDNGIRLSGVQRATINGCRLASNAGNGLYATACEGIDIMQCHAGHNGVDGLHIDAASSSWTIHNNTARNNSASGITCMASYSRITNNTLSHNGMGIVGAYGIDIGFSATTTELYHNHAKHNGASPGLPVTTDTNFSEGVRFSPIGSAIGAQVSPGGGVGLLENVSTR